MQCKRCGSEQFRTSRLQLKDYVWMVLLVRPVRCRRCEQRAHATLAEAERIRQQDHVRRRESWKEQKNRSSVS